MLLDYTGKNGADGRDGANGKNGKDGQKIYRTETDRETGERRNVLVRTEPGGNGEDGENGSNGFDGDHGQQVEFTLKRVANGFSLSNKSMMKIIKETIAIDVSGGRGGRGGNGGKGGSAGSGNPPGRPGVYGVGGSGGDGGHAGSVTIHSDDPQILPIVRLIAEGGSGGKAGGGASGGRDGRNGMKGGASLLANYNGKVYKDNSAGLQSTRIKVDSDLSRKKDNFPAGSKFTVSSINISNPCNIPIPSPFSVCITSDVDWVKVSGGLQVDNEVIEPRSNTDFPCKIKVEIDNDIQIGYFKLKVIPFIKHNDVNFNLLDSQQNEITFNYSVNHRFTLNHDDYSEVSKEKWEKIFELMEGMNPHEQYTACVGLLLRPILYSKSTGDDSMWSNEHYKQLIDALDGEFFDNKIRDNFVNNKVLKIFPFEESELAFDLAIDFLQHFDTSCHQKIMDALVFAGTMGDVLEEQHKTHIRKFADAVFSDPTWVKKKYALIYKKGNRKVQASSTNHAVNYLLTLPVFLWFSVALYLEHGMGAVFKSNILNVPGFFEFWSPLHNIIIPVYFIVITLVMRRIFFRRSCPKCMSVMLDPISKSDSSYDEDITHRCLDCGTRSSENKKSEIAQLFISNRATKGKKHFLEIMPGSKVVLYGINAIQILINPLLWLYLASMTYFGRFDKQKKFLLGVKKSMIAVVGFAIITEILRRLIF